MLGILVLSAFRRVFLRACSLAWCALIGNPSGILSALRDNADTDLIELASSSCGVREGKIPHDAAESFLAAMPSKAVVSRCRPLHAADHALCCLAQSCDAQGLQL